MRVSRRRGRLRLQLEPIEAETLSQTLDQLDELVRDGDAGDPVVVRLFPSAYPDDADAEADYRSITESGLRSERLERIEACGGELAVDGTDTEIDLGEPDVAQRWLRTLNDLRLALGTRIGVTEDDYDLDPRDPDVHDRVLYQWLTQLQDVVVVGLME